MYIMHAYIVCIMYMYMYLHMYMYMYLQVCTCTCTLNGVFVHGMCILACELSCVLSCVLQQQMMSYCFLSLFGQSMAAFNALQVIRGCLCVVS